MLLKYVLFINLVPKSNPKHTKVLEFFASFKKKSCNILKNVIISNGQVFFILKFITSQQNVKVKDDISINIV